MDIKTTPTLTDFLQAETINAEKKKTYYQRYDVKRLRAFHNQAMIKQQVYDNMLARPSGMEYSAGILFQTSIINMKQAQELTKNNQPEKIEHKRCRCGSIKHSQVSTKDCPVGLAMRKSKKMALGMALSKSEAKKTVEDAAAVEERICMAAEATGENLSCTCPGHVPDASRTCPCCPVTNILEPVLCTHENRTLAQNRDSMDKSGTRPGHVQDKCN